MSTRQMPATSEISYLVQRNLEISRNGMRRFEEEDVDDGESVIPSFPSPRSNLSLFPDPFADFRL